MQNEVAFPGLNPLQFTNTPNSGVVFFPLKPFDQRHLSAEQINAEINQKIAGIQEAFAFSLMPPPIQGLGNGSGYALFIEDRANLGYGALQSAVGAFQGAASQTPGLGFPITSYQANVPQLDADVDRVKAKAQGVPLTELFDTLQTYLGSAYVNDFNLFGRTWQVIAQADGPFRDSVEDIANLRARNDRGEMVPIGSMVTVSESYGPDPVIRYNGYPAADLLGEADPRVMSSGQAMAAIEELATRVLPNGMNIEWTDLSYEEATQSKAALVVFPLAILLAFLVLAALYESWTLPLAVILIVPMCMLSALLGVKLTGGDNNTFVQVGLGRADGSRLQERDPDRRVRPRAGDPGQGNHRGRTGSLPPASAPDRDDFGRLHRRHRAAGALARRGRGSAFGHGHHRVRRDARRDALRPVPDPGVLCRVAQARDSSPAGRAARAAPGGRPCLSSEPCARCRSPS